MSDDAFTVDVASMDCNFDAPKFADFKNLQVADDSWFNTQSATSTCPQSARSIRSTRTPKVAPRAVMTSTFKTPRSAGATIRTRSALRTAPRSAGSRTPRVTKLVQPVSPQFLTDLRVGKRALRSTEDLEIERVHNEVEEARKRRKATKEAKSKALHARAAPLPVRSTKQLTTPMEFDMATDRRSKLHPMALRSEEFVSTAQMVNQFQSKTPKRFRSKSKMAKLSPQQVVQFEPTQPVEPHFHTHARSRSSKSNVMSTEERELQELAKLDKFHARPVNKRVMESNGELGVPRVPKASLTAPVEPKFHTDARLGPKQRNLEEKDLHATTVKLGEKLVLTEPQPFSLATEERGQLTSRRTQEQIEREAKAEMKRRQFKAQPMPDLSVPPSVVAHQHPILTQPQPFDLESTKRHAVEQERIAGEIKRKQEEEEQKRQFKARPIMQGQFELKKLPSALTEVSAFTLNSNSRAVKRCEFEEHLRQKDAELAAMKAEQEAIRKAQEDAEIKQLRKHATHKALPLPKSVPFVAERSMQKLTMPESPALHSSQRDRVTLMHA